jgi:hypothetical protein
MKLLFTSLIGLFLLGCYQSNHTPDDNSLDLNTEVNIHESNQSDHTPDDNHLDLNTEVNIYESNQLKWNDSEITSYTFNYEYKGIFEITGKWEIQVHNGEVIYVNYVGDGSPVESFIIESTPTISTLFEDILACNNGDGCSVTEAEFDDDSFFPTYIYKSTTKDGSSFTITEFVVQ